MKVKADPFIPGALILADQAVHLLRQKGFAALACYYVGCLPFLLGLLYFWSDMSRNPDAGWYCAPAALGLALLFVWMKLWQVRFCRRLWCALQDTEPEPWPLPRSLATAARQVALQSTGMIVLLPASVMMLPLAWTYAFYQNLSVMDGPDTKTLRDLYADASRQALLWPGQNHLFLLLMSGVGLFVCMNVAAGFMLLPYLLKWLLGVETTFTISGLHAVTNTTFLAIVGVLTYACIDPIIKAAYTLRCFYGQSRSTGDDLRAGLKLFLIPALLAVLFLAGSVSWVSAGQQDGAPHAEPSVMIPGEDFVEQLDNTIDQVLTQRRFAWRLPREKPVETPAEKNGWLWTSLRWLGDKVGVVFESVGRWWHALSQWVRNFLPEGEASQPRGGGWDTLIRIVFYAVGAGLMILLLLFVGNRLRDRRGFSLEKKTGAVASVIDLNDETLTADDLPRERWVALAEEMISRREFRQALRAYYLSILAQLGHHGRVVIARYKSNRDYLGELCRRSHAEPELLTVFSRCMAVFERSWYGMHAVAEDQLSQFISDQERISSLVQQSMVA